MYLVFRIVLVFYPLPGYIHPDEYFQTVEVVTGDVLGTRTLRTWEFNTTAPLRSMTLNMAIFGGPLYLLRTCDFVVYTVTGWNVISSYTINLVPRLIMLALSFISDYAVFQICHLYQHSFNQCLTTLASSYVMLIYSTRTFSNSLEMVRKIKLLITSIKIIQIYS